MTDDTKHGAEHARPDHLIGRTIRQYRIRRKLGEGGMGVVYEAVDTTLDRTVALKFLPFDATQDETSKRRLIREAKAASALDHPNICTIYEIGETEEGTLFIAMACYDGETLRSKLARGALPIDLALNYARQIAAGLARAHQAGIVHRDVKPSNIMLADRVKLLDFGVAKSLDRTQYTREGATVGTAAYMSPEQANGDSVDQRTDVWSLGAILYEMLTGISPFYHPYPQATLYAVCHKDPPPVSERRTGIPEGVERAIAQALAKDPDERYESIDAFIADLDAGEPTPPEALAPPEATSAIRPTAGRSVSFFAGTAAVVAVVIAAAMYLLGDTARPIQSIAVLPLTNLSGDPDQEYFADGMTETLITDLGKIASLHVISRQSVMAYKQSDKLLPDIADELGVDAIVEGSALRDGDRVRITVKLVDAASDRQLWNARYDRDARDVLAIHSDVARSIAREIKLALTSEEENRLTVNEPVDPEAHEAYLKGRHHLREWTAIESDAIRYFNTAISEDPDFALAYTGLADAYLQGAHVGFRPREAFPKAMAAAEKALGIDPSLAEAHTILADSRYHYDWNWSAAEEGFLRAIDINPGYATAHWWYGGLLATQRRFDEAASRVKTAQKLDPLTPSLQAFEARIHFYARDFETAELTARKTLDLNPNVLPARYWLARSLIQQNRPVEALDVLQQQSGHVLERSALAQAYAAAGRPDEAVAIVDALIAQYQEKFFPPHLIVLAVAATGDTDAAIEWLRIAEEERDAALIWANVDPGYDPLRSNPRFADLLTRMRLDVVERS